MSTNSHPIVAMGDLSGLARISATLLRPSKEDAHTKDENQLKKAQLEKLHSERILSKKAIIVTGEHGEPEVLELSKLHKLTTVRKALLDQVLSGDDGAAETGQLLRKVRERFEKAGVPINDVFVRWKNLSITGHVEIKTNKSPHITEQIKDGFKMVRSLVTGRPAGDVREMQVLDGVSGVLKPGRFTVLLGPPGSGKSSLMKSLAGQLTKDKSLKVSYDELTYNGLALGEFVAERTAAYVSQVDQHFGELTVRETFDFSARCQMSQTRKTTMEMLEEREKELGITPDPALAAYLTALQKAGRQNIITDLVIKTLGLDICAETVVGNNMLRGISGGQKKRVTTGEMMVGPMKVLFADEISTGLDSATTFDICKSLRESCHVMQATMLVSLLQPAPETYDLFDDVMVLSSGKLIFHGPREMVVPFFNGLGFACPRMKGVADFLQEVNTLSDQERFWTGTTDAYRYLPASEIADAFYATEAGAAALAELNKPSSSEIGCHAELAKHMYGQSWPSLLRANLRRQVILQQRTAAFAIIRIFQCVIMGFATGTLFLNQSKLNLQDAQLFMSVGFFSVLIQLVGAFPASAILIDRLPVYYKHREAHFYPAWCFALPELLLQLPLMLAESWIWTLMVYFMVGFYTSARLLVFWGFMIVTSVWGLSLFMALSCISRSHAVATAVQSFAMLIFLVASGFIANAADMPGGWIGAFYSNPIAYFIKGLVINELTSPDWDQPSAPGSSVTLGQLALTNRGYPTEYYNVWIGLFAVGLGSTVINLLLFVWAATYLSPLKGTRAVSEEVVMERSLSKGGNLDKMVTMNRAAKHLANGNGDLEEGGEKKGKVQSALPFKPLVVTFRDVYYSVPLPKGATNATCQEGPHSGQLLLLKNISGCFCPGVLTALMGASGAGKTTLMDVLAGRKTGGKTTGEIMINGYQQQLKTFNRVVGYVEQNDVHIPEATVLEALLLSARLRLPADVALDVKEKFVNEVLALVELTGIMHAQIGTPGLTGLSVEQRKRLTIAVELVSNPSIVFMDEPTSGLDARAASFVMRAVRNTVNTGRTVVCTIHQPSLDIFLAFDELLLLKRGGETVFNGAMGTDAVNLINYFSAVPGVPAIKPSYNPSNWMLEVTAPDAEAALGINFAERFQKSELAESTAALIDSLSQPKEGVPDLTYGDMNVTSFAFQTRELLMRNFQQYARKYDYNVTRLLITFVIGMCFGTLFMDQGSATDTFNGVVNIAGALYMSVLFLGIIDCFMVQDVIFVRRAVYYREHAAGMYGVGPYIAAEALVEVPYVLVQGVIYSLLVYWMIGFEASASKFIWFFFIMVLSLFYWVLFGVFCVHVTPNPELAQALSGFSFGFVNLFCGFLKPRPAIPAGWIWMYWINPLSYTLYALVVGQLGNINTVMESTGGGEQSVTVAQFINSFLGYEWGFRWWCVLIIVGYILFFFATSTLALKKLKWQSR